MTQTPHRRFKSLEEWAKTVPVGTIADIPHYLVTPELRKSVESVDPLQRTAELLQAQGLSARDVATECAGLLDKQVSGLLSAFVVAGLGESLFGPQGKVRDFELRQDLALALGLVTAEEHAIQGTIRKIRNRFAHDPDLRYFEHDSKVLGYISSLPLPPVNLFQWPTEAPRDRLVVVTQYQVMQMTRRRYFPRVAARDPLDLAKERPVTKPTMPTEPRTDAA